VTAGTILAGTRIPLVSWFAAVWYVVNQKNGVSALGLQRVLGFGSYQTAWASVRTVGGRVRDSTEADAPRPAVVALDRDHDQRLAIRAPAAFARFHAAKHGFVDLNRPAQQVAIWADHRPPKLVQPRS
jgi:hypothetical protein